jgi:hypothetical protein
MSDWSPPGHGKPENSIQAHIDLSVHAPGSSQVSEFYRKELLRLVGDDSAIVDRLVAAAEEYVQKRSERIGTEVEETGEAVVMDGEDMVVAGPPTRENILEYLEKIETLATQLAQELNPPNPFFGWLHDALPADEKNLVGPEGQFKLNQLSDAASAVRKWTETNYQSNNKDTAGPWLADSVANILSSAGVPRDRYLRVLRRCFVAVGEVGARADRFANCQWPEEK